jgi:predicted PurR-regulated permease PerM
MSSERIEDFALDGSLPRGLINPPRTGCGVIAALGMREFKEILGPVFLALVLSIAVHPVTPLLRPPPWPAGLASS